jgi:flagellar motor switch protein FliG
MSIGEEGATEVLKHMGPKEVQKIGTAMAQLAAVTKDQVNSVLNDFSEVVEHETALGVGSDDYIRNVLQNALGEDKASGVIDRILLGRHSKGLDTLKWMEPRAVAELIRMEHPQIIAIIMSYLDNDHASAVLAHFNEKLRVDVIMRISTLDGIQPQAMQELNMILEKQFSGKNTSNVKSSAVGGLKTAANILNFMEGGMDNEIIENVKDLDADLGQELQDNMFLFENLLDVDDRGIQLLLREVTNETLILALKGADNNMKEKIFKNMSKRAAEMLRDDLDAMGPVKLSDVETAQKEIIAVARRLAESGELALGGKEEYVG